MFLYGDISVETSSKIKAMYKIIGELEEIFNAYNAEDRINNFRNLYRDAEIECLESDGKNYQTSVYFMDIVCELEKMDDFMINISQALEKVYVK